MVAADLILTGRKKRRGLIVAITSLVVVTGSLNGSARINTPEKPVCLPVAQLHQNYPNPFNPRTMIPFSLERDSRVTLAVFDEKDRFVKTLVDCELTAGKYVATWNGRDRHGTAVCAGIYYYRLRAENTFNQGKAIVSK
jgi:hypothetical protein